MKAFRYLKKIYGIKAVMHLLSRPLQSAEDFSALREYLEENKKRFVDMKSEIVLPQKVIQRFDQYTYSCRVTLFCIKKFSFHQLKYQATFFNRYFFSQDKSMGYQLMLPRKWWARCVTCLRGKASQYQTLILICIG